jgi:hypothetical protein
MGDEVNFDLGAAQLYSSSRAQLTKMAFRKLFERLWKQESRNSDYMYHFQALQNLHMRWFHFSTVVLNLKKYMG